AHQRSRGATAVAVRVGTTALLDDAYPGYRAPGGSASAGRRHTMPSTDLQTTVTEVLTELATLANDQVRERNSRLGYGSDQFGVKLGDIRKVAVRYKSDHDLALALWETTNLEARLLALLLVRPKKLSSQELDAMVRAASFVQLADWLNAYVVKNHPHNEALRVAWMESSDPWAARAGWNLTAARIGRSPEGLD